MPNAALLWQFQHRCPVPGGAGGLIAESGRPGGCCPCACPAPWRFFTDAWHRHIPPAFDGVHFTSEGHRRFIREPEGPLRQIFPG